MPTKKLPDNPSLENLKKQAKSVLKTVTAGDPESLRLVEEFHPRGAGALHDFALNDAQLVLARSYGFSSWAKLKQHCETVEEFNWEPPEEVEGKNTPEKRLIRLCCLAYDARWRLGDAAKAQDLFHKYPELSKDDLWTAAAVGDVSAVQKLLAREPGLLNKKGGPFRWEPLLYACYSRFPSEEPELSTFSVARLLLQAGADPNVGFLWKGLLSPFTALTGSFGNGEAGENEPPHERWQELAKLLLDAGADPNDGQTLYNRHFRPSDEHLKILFEYGLGQDKGGPWYKRLGEQLRSPDKLLVEELWSAARNNYFERVKLLVEHGTDVNTPGFRDGRTPYEAAVRAGNLELAEYLAENGAKRTSLSEEEAFAAACISGRREEALEAIRRDSKLLERIGLHRRIELLHRAVEGRHPEGIRLMAELGFELSGKTKHDNVGMLLETTPLHNAAWIGDLEMVKLLIELGAEIDARDQNYNATPLGWAVYNNQMNVAEYLRSIGAKESE